MDPGIGRRIDAKTNATFRNRTDERRTMLYEIEQYELHLTKFQVEADDPADAINNLFLGQGEPVDNSTELVEVADKYGMSLDDDRDLADRLFDRGILKPEDIIIPSIRSITQVE